MTIRIALGLALAAALPLAAQAHDAAPASIPAGTGSQEQAQVVVRDAESGKLRAATPEEHAALQALRANKRSMASARAAAVTPQQKLHVSGAKGVRLTDDMASFSVMVRGQDGKLVEVCFPSKEEADAAVLRGDLPALLAKQAKNALPTE